MKENKSMTGGSTLTSRMIVALGLGTALLAPGTTAHGDEVTDWNGYMRHAALVAHTSPMVTSRVGAMVQAAVFDAFNGIERRYEPIRVAPSAPPGASKRAAVVQAAYTILVHLFPAQQADFDAELAASLAALTDGSDGDSQSVARGLAWGQTVANAIWVWRSTDGFTPAPPPFLGGTAVGEWRPTPPAFASGAVPQFATMTPWAIASPSQFRPAGPPPLTSDRYTADFYETKTMGSATSTTRTDDGTLLSRFWNASTVTYYWNAVAVNLSAQRGLSLSQNARLLAVLNMAIADGVIACWNAKYTYVAWRPVTAIPLGDTDGNPDTIADPTWTPLLITPAHPEYPSGHSTTSGAAATVLAAYFGENTTFTVDSDVMTGVTRTFSSFTAALEEIKNARIFGGIHYRFACNDGTVTGQSVANYILDNAVQRLHGVGSVQAETDAQ